MVSPTIIQPPVGKARFDLRPIQDVDQSVVAVRFNGSIFNGREPNGEGYETIPPPGESSYGICPGDESLTEYTAVRIAVPAILRNN
jgi:hypothetical protein